MVCAWRFLSHHAGLNVLLMIISIRWSFPHGSENPFAMGGGSD
jgi:hypothetical protein